MRASVFEDPGDEKSWRISQRAENLGQYYEGRDPSWYASAVAPLEGADRVLDLGCGPGLALRALRDQGSSAVLGIDRWPTFVADPDPDIPIVAHDLSLPMPFLESASFDGVLSHYVLDYVSPICVRQVLREAHRVLRPGGQLVVYLAAIGLAGGDESRTVAYSPQAMRALLVEAGFEEVEVEASPNERNTVARAWRSARGPGSALPLATEPRMPIDGDTQLAASFADASGPLTFELSGGARRAAFSIELPRVDLDDDSRVSACCRALLSAKGGTELQFWAWQGVVPVVAERAFVEFPAAAMRIASGAEGAADVSVWSPEWLSLEPPGDAHARLSDLPCGEEMTDAERAREGRRIVVDSEGDGADARDRLGSGANRFLLRDASHADLVTLDREWLDGKLHGIAVDASQLAGDARCELLLWTGWRQALLYLGGVDWKRIQAVAERRRAEMSGPVVLVDPALSSGGGGAPLPAEVAALIAASDRFFALLAGESLELSSEDDLARLGDRLLPAGPRAERAPHTGEATENLRYLTERILLTRLRQVGGHSWRDVGRRPPLR